MHIISGSYYYCCVSWRMPPSLTFLFPFRLLYNLVPACRMWVECLGLTSPLPLNLLKATDRDGQNGGGGWPSRRKGDIGQQVSCIRCILFLVCTFPLFAEPRGLVVLNAPALYNLQEQQVTDLLVGSAACHPYLSCKNTFWQEWHLKMLITYRRGEGLKGGGGNTNQKLVPLPIYYALPS